jgi:hypothetical protein
MLGRERRPMPVAPARNVALPDLPRIVDHADARGRALAPYEAATAA